MTEAPRNAFVSLRRRYRHAMTVRALRAASERGHREGRRVVHMLHVGKTGGTAVQAALKDAQGPSGLLLLLHGHGISLRDVPIDDEVFLFLREPVARFVSGFDMRVREGRPRHYRPWTAAERRAFARFDSAQVLALALRAGTASTRAEAQAAMRAIYHVRSHLSDWLVAQDLVRLRRSKLLFIGWQERLDADFQALVGLLGMPPMTNLPTSAFEANRASPDGRTGQLSDDAVQILRDWYAQDYAMIALLKDLELTEPPVEVLSSLAESDTSA